MENKTFTPILGGRFLTIFVKLIINGGSRS